MSNHFPNNNKIIKTFFFIKIVPFSMALSAVAHRMTRRIDFVSHVHTFPLPDCHLDAVLLSFVFSLLFNIFGTSFRQVEYSYP